MIALFALLASTSMDRAIDAFFDPTFAGIHKLGWFDWAILLPYFGILILLSLFGMHRYEMIRGYMKHKRTLSEGPAAKWAELPRVTIQLPLYNEKYVVERLIEETLRMDYPRELFQV